MSDCELAMITGGAVRLGRAIAFELARAGYGIVLHYHTSVAEAAQTVEKIKVLGVPVYALQADLGDAKNIEALFGQIQALPYRLSVLVNSAAVMPAGNLQEMGCEEWDAVMNLNLRAAWLCAKHAVPLMTQGGVIINITDTGVHKVWSRYAAYSVSKAGLEMLTRIQAKTYAPMVRVNAIAPGLMMVGRETTEDEWMKLVEKIPMKESGSPEAICSTVMFILNNQHLCGETITVDGGYQLLG